MKSIFRRYMCAIAFALPTLAIAQTVGVLHLRPLHLELPATWTFDGSKRPIEGAGPNGEKVLITVMHKAELAKSTAQEAAQDFASTSMEQLASNRGKTVIRPPTKLSTPEGKVGYSAVSQKSNLFGSDSYFIQYLLASTDSLIYLTFEGKGDAKAAALRFDKFFETQNWDD